MISGLNIIIITSLIMRSQRNHTKNPLGSSIRNIRIIDQAEQASSADDPLTSRTAREHSQTQRCHSSHRNQVLHPQKSAKGFPIPPTQKQNCPSIANCLDVSWLFQKHKNTEGQTLPIPQCQQQEISYITTMLEKLQRKEDKQMEKLRNLRDVPRQLKQSRALNSRLKEELVELKDLMKALLLEQEEERMFKLYQDE